MRLARIVLAGVLAAACESPWVRVVQAKAADDFGCSDEEVQVLPATGDESVARGCGHKATYVCVAPKNPFTATYSCSQVPSASSSASASSTALPASGSAP